MKKLSQSSKNLETVPYKVIYKNIKNLWMKLNHKNEIIISVPIGTKNETVEQFINKHIDRFIEHIAHKEDNSSINLEQNFFFLFGNKIFFEIQDNKLILLNENKKMLIGKKTIEDVINSYRKKQLKVYLIMRQLYFQKLMNIENHLIYVREKETAWATNHVLKMKIYYSTNLSAFSKEIIDYVIVHELAHNQYSNHSKDFWKFVEKFEPQYKSKKLKLRKYQYC